MRLWLQFSRKIVNVRLRRLLYPAPENSESGLDSSGTAVNYMVVTRY